MIDINANANCITVQDLVFKYHSKAVINGLSFDIKYGKVLGFLGSNGAGKTTTVKILTTILKPESGIVYMFGKDSEKFPLEIKKRIGVVYQHPSFEENLTVEQSLDLYGLLWNIKKEIRKKRVDELLKDFDLNEIRKIKTEELSIGQKRRVQIAREFMHEIDLLFLDEPTVGLDPHARRSLLDYIKKKVSNGLTVFFTTHIMEEAEYLCDKIAIIDKGKIVSMDTPAALKERHGNIKIIEMKISTEINESIKEMVRPVIYEDNTSITFPTSDVIKINSQSAQKIMSKIIDILSKNNIAIQNISVNSPSLEDVFLTIIQENQNPSL